MTTPSEEYLNLLRGGPVTWNQWREANGNISPSLDGLDLSGLDLRRANLANTDMNGTSLKNTDLREARLQYADLTNSTGLLASQLERCDLSGTKLPPDVDFGLLDNITSRVTFFYNSVIATSLGCAYAALTVATTTDVRLITNSVSSPLPIISTSVPIVAFYIAAPFILTIAYLYLQLSAQRLEADLLRLPCIFPDGLRLSEKIASSFFATPCERGDHEDGLLARIQLIGSRMLVWLTVPLTLVLMLWRYIYRHDLLVNEYYIVLIWISVVAALYFRILRIQTIHGFARIFRRSARLALLRRHFGVVSILLIPPITMGVFVFSELPSVLFPADLKDADVSTKPANWTGLQERSREEIAGVKGAQLAFSNLNNAKASGAFLAKSVVNNAQLRKVKFTNADLRYSDLRGSDMFDADLRGCDLRNSNLSFASLADANLSQSNLRDAHLTNADVAGAVFDGADLMGTNLQGIRNVDLNAIKRAINWDKAQYDVDLALRLGLGTTTTPSIQR